MERRRHEPLPLGGAGGLPYSRGLMVRALLEAGVPAEHAQLLAHHLGLDLRDRDAQQVELDRLEELACELLGEQQGSAIGSRLRRLAALQRLEVPIVVLLGGATGTGKSTVATDVAHRLGITRVTSTDFIRQTLRAYFSPSEMPAVHASSFEVADIGGDIEAGFLEQTRCVLVGVQAAIERALNEGWSMVIEGVHLVPGLVPREIEGALVVNAVLQVESAEIHRQRFFVRDAATGGVRGMQKYLEAMDSIRALQERIVDRAAAYHVPVIESSDIERASGALLEEVFRAAVQLDPVGEAARRSAQPLR